MTNRAKAAIFASAMASTRAMAVVDGETAYGYIQDILDALEIKDVFAAPCTIASKHMTFDGNGVERWANAHARLVNNEPEPKF